MIHPPRSIWLLACSLALTLAACGLATTPDDASAAADAGVEDAFLERDAGRVDASTPVGDAGTDAATVDMGAVTSACANHIPEDGSTDPSFGTVVGRSFAEFRSPLLDCNGGSHVFYDQAYCALGTTFTVVSIVAGWCHPCQTQSALLTNDIVHAYGPHGVRVVQLLVQDSAYNPPSGTFCNRWVSNNGLTVTPPSGFASGNYELLDPTQITNIYFPDGALPTTLIVDDHGVIRYTEAGAGPDLSSLTTELDSLLGL